MADYVRTSIGYSDRDSITVRGRDVSGELMGRQSFADVAFLLSAGREPTAREPTLFNAVLISLAPVGVAFEIVMYHHVEFHAAHSRSG